MSKSDSCLNHIDADVTTSACITADLESKTKKHGVVLILKDQTEQSYGDVLHSIDLHRHDQQGNRTNGTIFPFTTDLNPKDAWVEPNMTLDQLMSPETTYKEDGEISVVDKATQKENNGTAIIKSLETYIGVPSKETTTSPSAGQSRPHYRPSFVLVNGEWVNMNVDKQPCILVRFKQRMARVFRRMNRWYEEVMLDLVMLRAQRQANKRKEDGLRQQKV